MLSLWKRQPRTPKHSPHPRRPAFHSPRGEQLEERCLLTAFEVVYFWNQVAIEATRIDHGADAPQLQFGPTRASRALAIESAAVFDAVNSIDRSYTPYLVQVDAPPDASIEAAAAYAAHDTLVALYPYQQDSFDVDLARSLVGIPDGPLAEGQVVGQYCAQAILAARANDGSDATMDYQYGQYPGQWRADPVNPNPPAPLGPLWGYVTPFAIPSAQAFYPPPTPSITSVQYATAYNEVKSLGSLFSTTRTHEETNIGIFWGYDAQPGLCAPVRLYNQIAEVLSVQMHNTEVQNARFFALINMAMADAAISVWGAKFSYDYWRPVTAIRENDPGTGPTGLGSGNPFLVDQGDVNWQPFGAPAAVGYMNFTPPFPSYTSGHAGIGGSMFAIMTDFFGRDEIPFTAYTDEYNTLPEDQFGNTVPLDPRSFSTFSSAAGENGQSRIYLGIHYQFDKTEGIS
jgi:hypothetical protein